ncbi:Gfo/Idh/MocA family oxidoreductase [Alphaproteobacteria bacterium]|nr:Gfo/Idh/MocA family oxidoreductase [Alphaproteobacteria bacterium]
MTIKIALIGCGMWGKNIARNASELGVLAAVCDNDSKNAQQFSSQFSCPALTFEEILADNTISGVVIVTNANSHESLACTALSAGKHVYIEKPLALSMSSANLIKNAALSAKRQVMVGHLIHYHPAYVTLQKLLFSGAIGRLQHIQANRLAMGRIRKSESAIYDLCPHDISIILGLVKGMPLTINCNAASHVTQNGGDIISTYFQFSDNVTAMMNTSWYSPIKEHRLVVIGESGSIVFDDTQPKENKITLYRDSLFNEGDAIKIERETPQFLHVPDGEPLRNEISEFISVCRTGKPAITDINEALRVQEILSEMSHQTQENKI